MIIQWGELKINNSKTLKKNKMQEIISNFATKEELENYSLSKYTHTYSSITGKPSTFAPTIGTTATTAKAGNYTPTATEVVTALKAMTPTQIDEIKTLLGITTV